MSVLSYIIFNGMLYFVQCWKQFRYVGVSPLHVFQKNLMILMSDKLSVRSKIQYERLQGSPTIFVKTTSKHA